MNHSSIVAKPSKLRACAVLASAAFTMAAEAKQTEGMRSVGVSRVHDGGVRR